MAFLVPLKNETAKKTTLNGNEKGSLSTCHKSIATKTTKLHELHLKLLFHPPYSPDLTPSDYYLVADLKRILQLTRFDANKEVIAKTEGQCMLRPKINSSTQKISKC